MTDTNNTNDLSSLKEQADMLGIEYPKNITANRLKTLIENFESQESENDIYKKLEEDNLKLVKVIITPNDPMKRNMQNELFAVGNAYLGTITRVIPFGKEWLIENILYKMIKEKEYQYLSTRTDNSGKEVVESIMLPAYNIQELPLPTKEEIEELAKVQQAKNSLGD